MWSMLAMNVEFIQSYILGAYTEDSSFLEKDILLFIYNVTLVNKRRPSCILLPIIFIFAFFNKQ